jgi:hypothetical protein
LPRFWVTSREQSGIVLLQQWAFDSKFTLNRSYQRLLLHCIVTTKVFYGPRVRKFAKFNGPCNWGDCQPRWTKKLVLTGRIKISECIRCRESSKRHRNDAFPESELFEFFFLSCARSLVALFLVLLVTAVTLMAVMCSAVVAVVTAVMTSFTMVTTVQWWHRSLGHCGDTDHSGPLRWQGSLWWQRWLWQLLKWCQWGVGGYCTSHHTPSHATRLAVWQCSHVMVWSCAVRYAFHTLPAFRQSLSLPVVSINEILNNSWTLCKWAWMRVWVTVWARANLVVS